MTNNQKGKKESKAMPLESMNLTRLRREYHLVFGLETSSKSKDYLRKKIAERRDELATERAARRAENGTAHARDARLPKVGAEIERVHDGKTHKVKVLDDGFEYARKRYTSLSAIAKAITGTNWNGFGFFGLLGASKGLEA